MCRFTDGNQHTLLFLKLAGVIPLLSLAAHAYYIIILDKNSNLIMIMEFSQSFSTTVDLLSLRERLRLAHRQYRSRQ